MHKKTVQRPPVILVLATLVFLGVLFSREVFQTGSLPAFSLQKEKNIFVEMKLGESELGVYQINDGSTLCDVINLTDAVLADSFCAESGKYISLVSGTRLVFTQKDQKISHVKRGWMSAGKRISLSIPLHPDRMNIDDWSALPGIGEKLASRIETDRQKNGEYGAFENLVRVRGIGQKSLSRWRKYFSGA